MSFGIVIACISRFIRAGHKNLIEVGPIFDSDQQSFRQPRGELVSKLNLFFLSCFVLPLVVGCATTDKYEGSLKSWIGQPEIELLRAWGAPQAHYETGGIKFLTFERRDIVFFSSTPRSAFIGNPTYHTTMIGGSSYLPSYCQTTFEIQNERVTNFRFSGNDCRR